MLDITGADDGEMLDITAGDDADTLDITGGDDAGTLDITDGDEQSEIEAQARSMLEDSLDLGIPDSQEDTVETVEMEAIPLDEGDGEPDSEQEATGDFDLSLQSAELDDLSIGGDTVGGADAPEIDGDPESEIEFDLALQDTTEMDSLVIDDTLELPQTREPDETLDDLTKSMEESMAELDLEDGDLDIGGDDEGELDLSLADTTSGLDLELDGEEEDPPSIDFEIDDLDIGELDAEDTVKMDLNATAGQTPAAQDTVILPVDEPVETQSESDEIDTKLNLAKAYIELGDNDGARSILDEVARDGSADQQAEAQRLIDQLG